MRLALAQAVLLLAACGPASDGLDAREEFWNAISALCGQAFAGRVAIAPPGDTSFSGRELVMHVRSCTQEELRIPFHVGTDRSRTWVLTRTTGGLLLKHDHRHEDGTEDAVTQYGGASDDWDGWVARNSAEVVAAAGQIPGASTATIHEFPADTLTASLIPAARSNIWTIEIQPGSRFTYALRRVGTDREFRVEFDLTAPVPLPPAPWGSSPP